MSVPAYIVQCTESPKTNIIRKIIFSEIRTGLPIHVDRLVLLHLCETRVFDQF